MYIQKMAYTYPQKPEMFLFLFLMLLA